MDVKEYLSRPVSNDCGPEGPAACLKCRNQVTYEDAEPDCRPQFKPTAIEGNQFRGAIPPKDGERCCYFERIK